MAGVAVLQALTSSLKVRVRSRAESDLSGESDLSDTFATLVLQVQRVSKEVTMSLENGRLASNFEP